jgi:CxxC-x17-CxxC domain-containing protein
MQAHKLKVRQGNNNMYNEKREMHTVTCADCGKETQVPFKPDGSRPVYCRDCFQKHKPKRY